MGSLGWEDLLEEEMVTHTSILVWKILWTEKTASYSLWDCKELDMNEQTHTHMHTHAHAHTRAHTHTHTHMRTHTHTRTHTSAPQSHSQKALYRKTSLKLKGKKTSNHMEKDKTKYFHKR